MPTYQNNIPQPTDILSDSQNDILENFQQLDTVFAINHHTYEAVNEGKHKQVTLPNNAAPTPTVANEANLYSKIGTYTGLTELAWQRSGAGDIIEFTESFEANDGWTRLPSGILLKWGLVPVNGLGNVILFPPASPVTPGFVSAFSIQVTSNFTSGIASVSGGTLTAAQFVANLVDVNGAPVNGNIYYFAIGT